MNCGKRFLNQSMVRNLRSEESNPKESFWWKDLKKVWRSEEWRFNFEDNVTWRLGDGKRIKFWEDKWLHSEATEIKFTRLFSITIDNNTNTNLSQMRSWINDIWH